MKGIVRSYGYDGSPIIKGPGGKIIFLCNYGTLPKIGSEVSYVITGSADKTILPIRCMMMVSFPLRMWPVMMS